MSTPVRFSVGSIQGTIIHYGESAGPPGYLFPTAPADQRDSACASHLVDEANLGFVYSSLLLERGEDFVVIDTGPSSASAEDQLASGLMRANVAATDIRHVILSHAHPDHVGGVTSGPGSEPRFGNAAHHLLTDEWRHWMESGAAGPMTSETRRHLEPIGAAGSVETHDDETEILPGVVIVPTPGHTPGHLSVIARDRGETLVYLGDVVTHSIMVEHPEWHSVFDAIPALATKTRRRMIRDAERSGAVVVASHIRVPGRIVAKPGSAHVFEPLGT